MPKHATPLTDIKIKQSKPKEKNYKLTDGKGLYIIITPKGFKWWRLDYTFENKRQTLSLGTYPTVTLVNARKEALKLKEMISQGINPLQVRKDKKESIKEQETKKENTFYNISQKWHTSYKSNVSENYHLKLSKALDNYLYATHELNGKKLSIKDKPIDEVTRKDIIFILEALKDRGLQETANRTAVMLQQIFRYAVTHEYIPHNIIFDIDKKVVLGIRKQTNYPTITDPKEIKNLLLAIDNYNGDYSTQKALQVLPYLFVRNSNLRLMEWTELDFEKNEWNIPKEKMKTKEAFILPLPHQVVTILKEIKENQMSSKYVFVSSVYKDRAISDNTLILALRRLGYTKEQLVPHSFRSIFSTIANTYANDPQKGHGYTSEVIEALLAHKEPNKVKSAYNRATYIEAMRGLVGWYGNYLDEVKNG
ncbi:MAG: tyrosine-type recombinase/integrase [Sulfurovaceae bacterium]